MKGIQCLSSSAITSQFKTVTVIGGGLMGTGITQVVAQHGQNVNLVDVNENALSKARAKIEHCVGKFVQKTIKDPRECTENKERILKNIKYSTDISKSVENSDVVVESVSENLEIKQNVLQIVEKAIPEHAILCTNTSSIPVKKIGAVLKNKGKFGGVHFFNPVPLMKLVEVIRSEETSDETYQSLIMWSKSIGRTPVLCKDTPGFIVNRLLFPLVSEAIRMYERGDASLEDIDTAMKLGANHPMGPIELSDLIGQDTNISITNSLRESDPTNKLFEPMESQIKLTSQGKLGVKTGEGYYKYPKN